jgi:DNA-binding NarL/FixJ family response regulator
MDTAEIRVLVIDDHEIFRAGLGLLLEQEPGINVVAEARNKNEALEAVRSRPDDLS